jgi:biotin-dependent carboxylase-like uncharacterized protein
MGEVSALLIRRPGLLTTVQDLGRAGLGGFGVAVSGALDRFALTVANRLVGNPDRSACLELTGVGPEIELLAPVRLALTGGNLSPTLDGEPVEPWSSVAAPAGAVLRFGPRRSGARCYLAVGGGIDVPLLLGSVATDIEAGIGGLDGRPLQAGDRLAVGPASAGPLKAAHLAVRRCYADAFVLRLIPEPLGGASPALDAFLAARWRVSRRSNRMGFRLEGPALKLDGTGEALSEPIPPGTVQLPPGGEPILLMADGPTVGGYPRLGQVIAADASRAAQLWPGHEVRFRLVDVAEARALLAEQDVILKEAVS